MNIIQTDAASTNESDRPHKDLLDQDTRMLREGVDQSLYDIHAPFRITVRRGART
jgi:hypothetical protein